MQDPDAFPDLAASASAAEAATQVPFWLQPPEDAGAEEWKYFEGRTHIVGVAQAWQAGLRFILGEPGIPISGISSADVDAARCGSLTALHLLCSTNDLCFWNCRKRCAL